jgi:hypothetical protein
MRGVRGDAARRGWAGIAGALLLAIVGVVLAGTAVGGPELPVSADPAGADRYPYRSAAFTTFVEDSFRDGGAGGARDFYERWGRQCARFGDRCPGIEDGLEPYLDRWEAELSSTPKRLRGARAALPLTAALHGLVKAALPHFSLERGFEFQNAVAYGERQCFLQSVLIAGMLQRAGVDAGVAMVARSATGVESNNGHAVAIATLPDGTGLLIDASEPEPFVGHQLLLVRAPECVYVEPQFRADGTAVRAYRRLSDERVVPAARVRGLDVAFIRSQFDFYRGERSPGGLLATSPTPEGLAASERYLRRSVAECPANALAAYSLGRLYFREGNLSGARELIVSAERQSARAGWVPPGEQEFLTLVSEPASSARQEACPLILPRHPAN